jgi:hypothetical protein
MTMPTEGTTTIQSLTGRWSLALDPDDRGRADRWLDHIPDADRRDAPVPGTIQEVFPGRHGVAWYWSLFVPGRTPSPGERALLRFQAVDYLADVWVNGRRIGGHEGGEPPFALDATEALVSGENLLAVRVLNPTKVPIDGLVLDQTPHANKKLPEDFHPGNGRNYGGVTGGVDLLLVPAVRITDVFVRPDVRSGRIDLDITVRNDTRSPVDAILAITAGTARDGATLAASELTIEAAVGDTHHAASMTIPAHRRWSLNDPYLYRVAADLRATTGDGGHYRHTHAVQCGFRDFRVTDGFFRLNGQRLFLRSTHTGNHYPIGLREPADRDLVRRDLVYAKAAGFNMVRFIAGIALAEQLDVCDELGLLVYEETRAAWLLQDSPRLAEHFDRSVREMIVRDRNHPCVAIWGLLNETQDGPTFAHAAGMLPLVRALDPTRLTLLSSGRWDGDWSIGSVSNPGSATWDNAWGLDGATLPPEKRGDGSFYLPRGRREAGYMDGAGDAHVYPHVPHSDETNTFLRTVGHGSRPVFLSEYGIGSMLDVVQIMGRYQQARGTPAEDEVSVYRTMRERLEADWVRFGMADVYPFPQDLLRESQRLHARQRLLGLNLIRSNPQMAGHNVTGMLDHGYTGEGLWTLWREWKTGVVDALQDGFAPLRWCLFVEPGHIYAGRTVTVEVVLANEDVLPPGAYPARLRIFSPDGPVWEQSTQVTIPVANDNGDGPLAVPVYKGEAQLDGPSGLYVLAAQLEQGGSPAGNRVAFWVSDAPALPSAPASVTLWGVDNRTRAWLQARSVDCRRFDDAASGTREIIVVGELPADVSTETAWQELAERVARGSVALFLAPSAFRHGDDAVGWLPLAAKGRCHEFSNWLYHREDVARRHPIFAGLPPAGIMDWDYYGPVIPRYVFEGQPAPDDVAAAFFAVGYASMTEQVKSGYASGLIAASYPFGAGRFLLNSLRILENVDRHPAADRLLLNMVAYGTALTTEAVAPLPGDFDALLGAIGYRSGV